MPWTKVIFDFTFPFSAAAGLDKMGIHKWLAQHRALSMIIKSNQVNPMFTMAWIFFASLLFSISLSILNLHIGMHCIFQGHQRREAGLFLPHFTSAALLPIYKTPKSIILAVFTRLAFMKTCRRPLLLTHDSRTKPHPMFPWSAAVGSDQNRYPYNLLHHQSCHCSLRRDF